MKKREVAIILVSSLIIGIFGTVILYNIFYTVEEAREIDMHLAVASFGGFNITKDATNIDFGIVTIGGTGIRWLNISNNADKPLKVTFETYGELGEAVGVEENLFWLQPGELKVVKISATAKPEWLFGDYFGTLKIIFTRR